MGTMIIIICFLQCFDLESYLMINSDRSIAIWRCPVCKLVTESFHIIIMCYYYVIDSNNAEFEGIEIDGYILEAIIKKGVQDALKEEFSYWCINLLIVARGRGYQTYH